MAKKFIQLVILIVGVNTLINCSGKKKEAKEEVDYSNYSAPEETTNNTESNSEEDQLSTVKTLISSVSEEDIKKVDAKAKYTTYCIACHGVDGKLGAMESKDLTQTTMTLEQKVQNMYYGKKLMTPFKGVLTDTEIVAVAKYIEELK